MKSNVMQAIRAFGSSSKAHLASYSDTLQLPRTKFGPKVPSGENRERLLKEAGKELFLWQAENRKDRDPFLLHDGPPYANGELHMGHALNKIIKDIINRWEMIYRGKRIQYQPGWDCHGLPIEIKAFSNYDKSKSLSAVEVRRKCEELALSMVDRQRKQFEEFCIMADFYKPYLTLSREYEKNQLRVFLKLMENGLLRRQLKPVWWGCENQTALAEAELEYNPKHSSIAIYVKFTVISPSFYSEMAQEYGFLELTNRNINLLIWTSTPWTIPGNQAVCINSNSFYTLLFNNSSKEYLVVNTSLAEEIIKLNAEFEWLKEVNFKGEKLLGNYYENKASGTNKMFPILHGDHVTETSGTGLVHTAPAHGGEDYRIGLQYKLPILSCVDHEGCFIMSNIPPGFKDLEGLFATSKKDNWKCISILEKSGMLYHVDKNYIHSYPYDWRSKKPVIQRATPQWFVNLDKIKPYALKAIENSKFVPETGRNRLKAFVENRNEWCISRQRVWGVPLPFIYHKETGEPIVELEVVSYVVNKVAEFGTDEWFREEEDISRWLPKHLESLSKEYIKGKDTMDVWFDSGTSWCSTGSDLDAVFKSKEPISDVYLEGSDQHRGWFQSSLLNKIVASGRHGESFSSVAPFKEIVTHGFILDSSNEKMSKSKGNTISPLQVIAGGGKPFLPKLGTDGLRLWAASSNFMQDVNVSKEILDRVFENVKKLRVTFKFLLGNLNDFTEGDKIPLEELNPLDKYVLIELKTFESNIIQHYNNYNFSRVVRDVNTFTSANLSSQYFDISKDCLYTSAKDSHRRRSIQTVLSIILKTYIGVLAPICPMLVQEVWDNASKNVTGDMPSPFMATQWDGVFSVPSIEREHIVKDFNLIWKIKDELYRTLEELRLQGAYKNKLETKVNLRVQENSKIWALLEKHQHFLDDYFLISKVTLDNNPGFSDNLLKSIQIDINEETIGVDILLSESSKCPRCWKYISESEDLLCHKCESALDS